MTDPVSKLALRQDANMKASKGIAVGSMPLPPLAEVRAKRVYLCGPMTGYDEYNYPAFRAAAEDLRQRGFHVISPVELDEADGYDPKAAPPGFSKPAEYAEFLSRDIHVIAEREVDQIVVLPGWQDSGGAKTEVAFGRALDLPILAYPTLAPVWDGPIIDDRPASGEERIVNEKTGGEKGRKPQRYSLLPWHELGQVAELYAAGAKKYEDHNWRKGYDWSLSHDSLLRHLNEGFWEGKDFDEETGCHHLTAVVFHALALLYFYNNHPDLDDRPNTTQEEA